jgi:hypothetical protein
MKFLQQKNIKIYTSEEPLTDNDIEIYDRVSVASDLATQYTLLGGDPKAVFVELVKQGKLLVSDLESMGIHLDEADIPKPEPKPPN